MAVNCFRLHFFLLILFAVLFTKESQSQQLQRKIAILQLAPEGEKPDPAKTLSVKYMVDVAGVPFVITDNVNTASKYSAIIAIDGFDGTNLSSGERMQIKDYVGSGGILISPNFKDKELFEVFGIEGEDFARNRYSLSYIPLKSASIFRWIDEPEEKIISIGDQDDQRAINSRAYLVQQAEVLGKFDDGSPAFIRNKYGEGFAYAFGVSFKDVIVRNQIGRDLGANRSYSNGFEPTSDTFGLILRGMLLEHTKNLVWKHTAPSNSSSALIVSHDIDSESGMQWMNRFAKLENSRGITATYNITTHYISDALDGDYYTPYRDSIAHLAEQNQEIGSHSVGHFPDFDELPMGNMGETQSSYQPAYQNGNTQGATLLGELEVSSKLLEQDIGRPVQVFRAGHLIFPNKLINALDTLGYKFNSTFTSNNILTSFPYRTLKDRSFSGQLTDVWEIPLTISDVIDEDITEDNYHEMVDMWLNVTQKYKGNSAPIHLLIHPNSQPKLQALEEFLDRLDSYIKPTSIGSYGDFWIQRSKVDFSSQMDGNVLSIHLENMESLPERVSLKVYVASRLDEIAVYNKNKTRLRYKTQMSENGELILFETEDRFGPENREISENQLVKLHQNYPNPFKLSTIITYDLKEETMVQLKVYSLLGRKVSTLVNQRQQAGSHWVRFNGKGLSSGTYFYHLRAGDQFKTGQMLLVK